MSDRSTDARAQVASLGCGTLILVGLIVFFVGRWSNAPLRDEVAGLRDDVRVLTGEVQRLRAPTLGDLPPDAREALLNDLRGALDDDDR